MAIRAKINITNVAQLYGHKDAIYDFALDKDEGHLYTVGADGYVIRWDIHNPKDGLLIIQIGEAIYSIFKSENILRVGSRSGIIYSINLKTKTLLGSQKAHSGGIFFINDSFSGGEDGKLYIFSTKQKLNVSTKSLRCCISDNDGYYIGASDTLIYHIDKNTLTVKNRIKGHTNSVFGLSFLDKNTLVSTGRDAQIIVHDLTINVPVHTIFAHTFQAKNLSWNGHILLSCSMDKTIKLWDSQLNLLKVIDYERYLGHTNCINKTAWIDENMFVSCSDDRSLLLWKVEIIS